MASLLRPDHQVLISRVARELAARDLPFMLIGGQALLIHGVPRRTQDIDIAVGVGPASLDDVLQSSQAAGLEPVPIGPMSVGFILLRSWFQPFDVGLRTETSDDPFTVARRTLVLPAVQPETGIRVDYIFAPTRYEPQVIRRALRVEIRGESVPVATAEDLLLHKLFEGRPRDLEDAAGIVRRKRKELDWQHLRRWAREFANIPGHEEMPHDVELLYTGGMLSGIDTDVPRGPDRI